MLLQDQQSQRASVNQISSAKPLSIKPGRKERNRQRNPAELPDAFSSDEGDRKEPAPRVSTEHSAEFAERLQDAQRVEDLFEAGACSAYN